MSSIADRTETPETIEKKSEAVGLTEYISATRPQMLTIYNHFHSIGADNQLLTDSKNQNQMILQKWYQTLVIQNRRFPLDMPVEFVLSEFFNAILQKKVDIKGFNLLAHMTAFHKYMDEFANELRSRHWMIQNPNQRPLVLQSRNERSAEQKTVDKKRTAEAMRIMYGDKIPEHMKHFLEDEGEEKEKAST